MFIRVLNYVILIGFLILSILLLLNVVSIVSVDAEFVTKLQYELTRANTILNGMCPNCNDEPYDKIHNIFAYEYVK